MGASYLEYAKGIFRPKRLESVFLFVTSACNSLCRTCFYWDELTPDATSALRKSSA